MINNGILFVLATTLLCRMQIKSIKRVIEGLP